MHGDSVMSLRMVSAGGSMKVALALQEDHFLGQHLMQFSSRHRPQKNQLHYCL